MTTIKKAYVEIANLLNDNKNKKVSIILPQLMELMTAKSRVVVTLVRLS